MPTVKLDINTGLEYSPTDQIDSSVKLHNFLVGTDGSLYKIPALKNLKNTKSKTIPAVEPNKTLIWNYRLLDINKWQSSATEKTSHPKDFTPKDMNFFEYDLFRRFIFLSCASYGVINIDYQGNVVTDDRIPERKDKYGDFEYEVYAYKKDAPEDKEQVDLSSLTPEIIIDFNAPYNDPEKEKYPRAIFPAQHMFKSKAETKYSLLMEPKNMISCSTNATGSADVRALILDKQDTTRDTNDLAKGAVLLGNRMLFYSAVENAIFISKANDFSTLMADPEVPTKYYKIRPPEEVQGIVEFNGNLLLFTPTGIDRWVFNGGDEDSKLLVRDPTFKYAYRIRCSGSWVRANRDLYFYTDYFGVFVLKSDLNIENIFPGILPIYKPLQDYLSDEHGRDKTLTMAKFKMLGFRFISIGPWLYNIDSKTWSTYSYDGWKKPKKDFDPTKEAYLWENDTAKQTISTAFDDIVCTYSTICTPLSYKEMQERITDDSTPSLIENEYQWGEVAFLTTRMYQQESTFSVDGILVYVSGGILKPGAKMWLKILKGSEQGDFDIDDESSYGEVAYYQPMAESTLGDSPDANVGQFIWRMNVKCERFRVQLITKEKKGIVIQSVFANITHRGESLQKEKQQQG